MLTFCLTVILSILGVIFARPMVIFMGSQEAIVTKWATQYLRIQMIGFVTMANRIISEFGVDPKAKFNKLSLGQQKKAIIAVALSLGTKVLLMDEPSNGLDIPSKSLLRRLIAENASDDQLIIISTHQVKDLENLIDPIIIMDRESVLMNASIEEITRRLTFGIEPQEDRDALYCQRDLRGYVTVRRNEYGIETPVDLEALFNCALVNKQLFKELFNTK